MKVYQLIATIMGVILLFIGIIWFGLWLNAIREFHRHGQFIGSYITSIFLIIVGLFLLIISWWREIGEKLKSEI